MGLGEEAVVVLNVGSATGGVAASLDRFLAGLELLSDAARARLGIENDDRSSGSPTCSCSPMNSPAGLNSEIRSSRWSTIQTWPSSPKLAGEIISADRSGVRVARACWTRRACLRFCWRRFIGRK